MSQANFTSDGKLASVTSGKAFPLQANLVPRQGLNDAGIPVKVDPSRQMNTATAHGGATRAQFGDGGGTEDLSGERWRADRVGAIDSGVAGTARAALGMPRPAHELAPSDLVTLPGPDKMQVTASVAARLGYLRQLPTGGYANTSAGEPPAPSQAPQPAKAATQPAQPDPITTDVPVDEQYVGHTAVVQRGLPEVFVANAVQEMVKNGSFSPEAVNAAAKHLDSTPDAVLGVLDGAMKAHGASFERYVAGAGVRPADFTEWLQGQSETMALLMAKQASTGKTSVWAPLLRQFKSSKGGR